MKMYKLKKWYPSLPKGLKIGTELIYYPTSETYSDNSSGLKSTVDLHPEEVENNSEFWEKVEEKEYELLDYVSNGLGYIDGNLSYAYIGNDKITKVKRISDGEIFTIGDKVRIKKLRHDGSFNISRFYLDCFGDKLLCNGECTGNGHVSISKIEKKRVILVTDDGVDLFIGDKYYVPQKNTKIQVLEFIVEPIDYCSSVKRFSDIDKARKYMLRKTICLSMEDVYAVCNKAWSRGDGNPTSAFDRDLEELVKSKL